MGRMWDVYIAKQAGPWMSSCVCSRDVKLCLQSEGYVARSAYKLKEMQDKYALIPPGGEVLDLGCTPGAWLQVACKSLGPRGRGGKVLGIDIQATTFPNFCDDRVHIVQADARTLLPEFWEQHCPQVREHLCLLVSRRNGACRRVALTVP